MSSPIVSVNIMGGLGNQLFQIGAAAIYSYKMKRKIIVVPSGLMSYSAKREKSYEFLTDLSRVSAHISNKIGIFNAFSGPCRVGRFPFFRSCINDRNFLSKRSMTNGPLPKFMDGYFQSGWTQAYLNEVISLLNIREPHPRALQFIEPNEVAVHVRGLDFLKDKSFLIAGESFYVRCIEEAAKHGHQSYAFFSDDPAYCTHILTKVRIQNPKLSMRIASGTSLSTDFDCLRIATARIVGNSTFAWWASALSDTTGPTWSSPIFSTSQAKPFKLKNEIYISNA